MLLTATVRNGDIDQRNAFQGTWVSQVLLAQLETGNLDTNDAFEGGCQSVPKQERGCHYREDQSTIVAVVRHVV